MAPELQISDFSQAEMAQRTDRVRALMRERGLDALIVYDEGSFIGFASVRYLAGYSHTAPPTPAYMVVGPQGDPTLIISQGMGGTQLSLTDLYCPISNVKTPPGDAVPDWSAALVAGLEAGGYTRGRLGIDNLATMRYPVMEGLKAKLDGTEFVNARGLVEAVRRDKSEAELANFKKACELSKTGMDTFFSVVREGVPHSLALAEAEHIVKVQGGEELNVIMGAGDPWIWGVGHRGDMRFESGELVSIELNGRYHGYYSQLCRTEPLGNVSEDRQRIITAVRAAHDRMLGMLRPGSTGKELFAAGIEEVRKRGFDFSNVRYGHGLGLTIGEGFDFADWDETPIPEGAFGVIHPFIINSPGGRGNFNALWGEPWVLRAHGPELFCA